MFKRLISKLLIITIVVASMLPQAVDAKTHYSSGFAARSKSYVYFAFSSSKKATGIYRINVNNGQRDKIYPRAKSKLKAFENLNVEGKYIYCACRKSNTLNCAHIYRINIQSGRAKFIAKGANPVVIGGNMYYDGTKTYRVADNVLTTGAPTGRQYYMDKDGGKRKKTNFSFASLETSCRGTKISRGKYKYYIASDGKSIIRKRGRSSKTVFSAKKITAFRAVKGYLVVKTRKKGNNVAYCVKNNGSRKMKMITW